METNKIALFCDENFTKKEIEIFLFDISFIFIRKYFINKVISNEYYEKNVFQILKKLINKGLLDIFKNKIEICEDLSFYIFKKYFKSLFAFISEFLLKEIAYSNQNVIEFLKYYSLDVIVIDNIKYQVPQLKEEDGHRWNIVPILGVLKIYIKTQDYIDEIQLKIIELEKNSIKLNINSFSPIEHNNNLKIQNEVSEQSILHNSNRISILRDSISLEKDDAQLQNLTQELDVEIRQRLILRENKSMLVKQKVKNTQISEYNSLIKEIDLLKYNTKAQYLILEKNKDSYQSIKNSLFFLLISKKKVIF